MKRKEGRGKGWRVSEGGRGKMLAKEFGFLQLDPRLEKAGLTGELKRNKSIILFKWDGHRISGGGANYPNI